MDGGRENFSPQTDLRDFLSAVEEAGQLEKVNGAHWDKEMGATYSCSPWSNPCSMPMRPGFLRGDGCITSP